MLFGANNLNALVNEILVHDREPGMKPTRFSCDLVPGLPGVFFDSDQLKYVLRKILENTSYSAGDGREVRLKANTVVQRKQESPKHFVPS